MPRKIAAVILALVLAPLLAPLPALAGGPEPGDKAPELEVKQFVQGGPVAVADCEGEVLVVVFMHCTAPSMAEYMRAYDNLSATHGERGLKVVALTRENPDFVMNWWDENRLKTPVACVEHEWWKRGPYEIDGYPFAYVVDIYGEVAWKGDANRTAQVIPQIEKCLKEVRRITYKREDTSKSFDKIWRALDKDEYPNAIKFLQGIAKSQDEEDRKDAEELLRQIGAIADGRLARVGELEKRRDYLSGEEILRSVEKSFYGLPQSKAAKERREAWQKDSRIKDELQSAKLFELGRQLEMNRQFARAADHYRAAMAKPATRGAARANERLADLRKKGLVRD